MLTLRLMLVLMLIAMLLMVAIMDGGRRGRLEEGTEAALAQVGDVTWQLQVY